MTPYKVAIDVGPLLTPMTGIGQYTANLIEAMETQVDRPELVYFGGSRWFDVRPVQASKPAGRVPLTRRISKSVDRLGPGLSAAKKRLNRIYEAHLFTTGLKRHRPALFHGTNNALFDCDIPQLLTVHDISCFRHPQTHPTSRVKWQHENLPKDLERASTILTVSEFSRQELADYFSIPRHKIVVTPNGVGPQFHPRPLEKLRPILNRYGLEAGHYILSVGTLEPRKNLSVLVNAYAALPETIRQRYPLVLVGMRGWKEDQLLKDLEPMRRKGEVRILGYLPQQDLPIVVAGAKIFAYPSIYEGFGMPALEALASGIPSIVSNQSALPEVVGSAALLIDPQDVHGWTEALTRLIADKNAYQRLVDSGPEQATRFTWHNCAQLTQSAYQRVFRSASP